MFSYFLGGVGHYSSKLMQDANSATRGSCERINRQGEGREHRYSTTTTTTATTTTTRERIRGRKGNKKIPDRENQRERDIEREIKNWWRDEKVKLERCS